MLRLQPVLQPPCQSCEAPLPPVQGWLQPCTRASCRDCVELQLGLSLEVEGGRRCQPPHEPSCGWWEARTAQRLPVLGLQAAQLGGRLDLRPCLLLLWMARLLSLPVLHPACPASSCSSWAWDWLRQGRAGAGLSRGLCSQELAQGVAWAALGRAAAVPAQMTLHGVRQGLRLRLGCPWLPSCFSCGGSWMQLVLGMGVLHLPAAGLLLLMQAALRHRL